MKKLFIIALTAFVWLGAQAQESLTENPRGVYKMTSLVGKAGRIDAPYDQYKVCTDSITLMCNFEEETGRFTISHNDKQPHNHTGRRHSNPMNREPLIYDSNDKQFTLEWWSEIPNHIHFPYNGWCTEYYRSGLYSEKAKPFFDAIMQPVEADKANELIGTWRIIGWQDEVKGVKNMKKILEEMKQSTSSSAYYSFVFTPTHVVKVWYDNICEKVSYKGKNKIVLSDGKELKVIRLSKDCIAYPIPNRNGNDYVVLQRDNSGQPIIGKIASFYLSGGIIITEYITE